ncbi:MAG: metalloregulator ArsR/SmtB family transcription factor [Pseudomonadota bacterium]
MDINKAVTGLEALAHESRLNVFRLLVQAGPNGLAAGEIAEHLGVRQNTMSSHLQKLSRAGLVAARREGRHIFYAPQFEALNSLILYLVEDCCGRQQAVCKPLAASMTC